jgi:hypothetical protein
MKRHIAMTLVVMGLLAGGTSTAMAMPISEPTTATADELSASTETASGAEPAPDSSPDDGGELLAQAQVPGAAKSHDPQAKVTGTGEKAKLTNSTVGGGEVSVSTGINYTIIGLGAERKDGFSLGYAGKDAPTTRWLQFIWRELLITEHPDKTKKLPESVPAKFPTPYNTTYDSTSDPAKPNYSTDAGPGSPYFEDAGADNRDDGSITIFDTPNRGGAPAIREAFKTGATKVVSRAHFVAYLVRGNQVLYEVRITAEWVLTKPTDTPTATYKVTGDKADKLDPRIREQLLKDFPKTDYLP